MCVTPGACVTFYDGFDDGLGMFIVSGNYGFDGFDPDALAQVSGTGTLATITFRAIGASAGTPIAFGLAFFTDADFNDIQLDTQLIGADVSIASVTPVPEPGSLTLLGIGVAGVYCRARLRRRRR